MARGKGRSGRRYVRDAKGRFASKGYVGQTGGRGARLKAAGKKREGGGAKANLLGAGDQAMTSVPKGTIGKTRKLRSRQKIDMTRQEFARFEAGKKAAKADISRRKQKSGAEMSKAEFARRTGGKTRADSMSFAIEMSRQPRGRTKAGDRRNEARLRKIQDDIRATDKAYDAAIKSGKIKKPTTSLARKAAGEPSNPAVQAAQRLQAKIAAKRAARQAASKKPIAKTSKAPVNKAKIAYKRARADARMRNADLRGADVNERRMANTAAAKVKNMQRRRSASVPKASADSPRSRQTAKQIARRKRAAANERQAYDRWDKGMATDKDSRKASVAKRARAIYEGKIDPKVKTRARLTQTRNPDVLRDRIKRGEKLTAAKAKKAASKRRKRK